MTADPPAISVVTPLYNKAQSVSRAIESVLAQRFADFELIVVDDGSTDDGAARVRAFDDPRIRLEQQPNRGAAAARNRGVALARAAHVAFLDADDAWTADFLATVHALIERFPDAGAYATGYFIKNPGQAMRPARFDNVPLAPGGGLIDSWFAVVARGANPMWSSATCIPKRTFERIGGFPDGVRLYEDLHLWARIAIAVPIAYDATPCSIYYRDAENRRGPVAQSVDDLKFADAVTAALADGTLAGAEAEHARDFVCHYTLLCAFKTLLAGRPAVARAVARRATPDDPAWQLRRAFILALAALPRPLVLAVWRTGRGGKQAAARLRAVTRGATAARSG